MPRPRTSPQDQDNGYDAFLDIVANLVGILIILVMVVGVRMRQAFEDQIHLEPAQITVPAATQSPDYEKQLAERNELNQTIARTRQEAATVEQDTQVLAYKIDLLATETARQTAQRNQLQLLASAIEHEIQQHRAQLDEQSQQAFDGAQALAEVEQQLEQTRQAVRTVALEQEPPPTILKHYETPIATTVHGQEEHFRIKGGSIARIPLNELVDAMNQDCRNQRWKLEKNPHCTGKLPPIDGFELEYAMSRTQRMFVLHPAEDLMGVPVSDALATGARLRQHIDALSPQETTITVWTYPDSYSELRQFQATLVERGFRVATRPLPQDYPIGGSQRGRRSVAQ